MILYVLKVLEDGTPVPKHVEVIIIMSCGSWFVLYCTVFTGYVGRYIEYTKLHGMSRRNRKLCFLYLRIVILATGHIVINLGVSV